jgi:NitT/TauT family transport system ATP-binding protein
MKDSAPTSGIPSAKGEPQPDPYSQSRSVLALEEVTKTFHVKKNQHNVLAECSIDIRQGEFVSLLGPSGCGKSTLLNMLAGFDFPDTGRASFLGDKIQGPSPRRVMCFQDSLQALLPWRTVEANIHFALAQTGMGRSLRGARTDELLTLVGLDRHRASIPSQLSGGMRQKLQLARALAVEPDVLLMDEPFGALDAITRDQMQRELLRIWSGTETTVVFVTHDVTEAVLLSDTIHVMGKGPSARIRDSYHLDIARPRGRTSVKVVELIDDVSRSLEGGSDAA